MDNRTCCFLLITFAVCISLTESFPRFLTRLPDDLSKSEDSSEEQSGSYLLETQQQQQVLEKEYLFAPQLSSSEQRDVIPEQNGDNQFTFTSSGEQFTVEPDNRGTRQQEIVYTGDHGTTTFEAGNPTRQMTASDETGIIIDGQIISSSDNTAIINDTVTSISQSSVTDKTSVPFTEGSESSTVNPVVEFKASDAFDKIQNIPIQPDSTTSRTTTVFSVSTAAPVIYFETTEKNPPEKGSSASENKTKIHVNIKASSNISTTERPRKEDNEQSTLQQNLSNSPAAYSADISDRCDSATFVKPTAGSKPTNVDKCATPITDPNTPTIETDTAHISVPPTASSKSEKQEDTTLNNESKTGDTFDPSGNEPTFGETPDNRKTMPALTAESQRLDKEIITGSSESILLTSNTSSTDQSSSSLPDIVTDSTESIASDYSVNIGITESVDVVLPDMLVKNEHTSDNKFFIPPPFLSKHISKDGDKILYELHTSNISHDHVNHSDTGMPHNVLDEHANNEQHDSPHTEVSTNVTGNPHHTVGDDEPLLPHSRHMHDSLHTKLTGSQHHIIGGDEPHLPHSHHMNTSHHTKPVLSPQHIVGGDEPQLPHSHHMGTSHHTKPVGSPQHIVGGDEPQLPHSHHMKASHHTTTETLHHVTGGDEPKLPHSHHMNITHHANTSGNLSHITGSNEPKLPHNSQEGILSDVLRERITKEDSDNSSSHTATEPTAGQTISNGNLSEQFRDKIQGLVAMENNKETSGQPLTESTAVDSLHPAHTDGSSDPSFVSPVLFRNSNHASVRVITETVETDLSAQSTTQISLTDVSVTDNIDQISSDESILVSDEQYPSENGEFSVRNHKSQGSEHPQESITDIQFSDKPTILQTHVTDNSKSPIKETEISDDPSVQNQGSSSYISSIGSSLAVKEDTAQHQDTTFLSDEILPKKQANGDLQYFIEQVIYPKQIASNIMRSPVKQVSPEPNDIKNLQFTKTLSESSGMSAFESHSKPCNCSHTTENPLFIQNNETLVDQHSKLTSSASVTDFAAQKPSSTQSREEHRYTIPEILSTIPDDDNIKPDHGSMIDTVSTTHIETYPEDKRINSSSTVSTDSVSEIIISRNEFYGDETATPESPAPNSNDNIQQSILDSTQIRNSLAYNSSSNYYSSITSTTLSTSQSIAVSSISPGSTSTSHEVKTTSSQATTENPISTSSSIPSNTTSTSPEEETTSLSTSLPGSTEKPISGMSNSTSLDSTSISLEIENTVLPTSSQDTTENLNSSISISTPSSDTNTSVELEITSLPTSSQGTTKNPTSGNSSSTLTEVQTTSSSTSLQDTTKSPTSSTRNSTSPDTTSISPEVITTTYNYSTRAPHYRLLVPELAVSANMPFVHGYLRGTQNPLTTSKTSTSVKSDTGIIAPPAYKVAVKQPSHLQPSTASSTTRSDEHFYSTSENSDKDDAFSPTMTSDQLSTAFQSSDFSQIKFERPPKPYIGVKRGPKGGDRNTMFYFSKPRYFISEGRPLHNPF